MGAIAAPVPITKSIPATPAGTLTQTLDSIMAVDGVTDLPKLVPATSIPVTVTVNDASIASVTGLNATDIMLVSQDSGLTLSRATLTQLATFLGGGAVGQSIKISTIANQAVSTSFPVTATVTGYAIPPTGGFQYRVGITGSWANLPSPSTQWSNVSTTLYLTFTCPGITLASGLTCVYVRDATTTTIIGTSNPFTVGTTLPVDLGVLLAWFDASAGVPHACSDTALTVPSIAASTSGSGSVIGSLIDLSGQGSILTQATGSAQPYLQSASINSLPTFTFSGAQYLNLTTAVLTNTTLANLMRIGNITALVVYKPTGTLGNETVFSASKSATGGGEDQCKPAEIRSTGKVYTARNTTGSLNNLLSAGTYTTGTVIKEISRIGVPSATQYQSVNAATEVSSTISGADTSGGFDTVRMGCVNQSGAVTNPFTGAIAEIAIFAGLNTSAASTELSTYATAKWGS